MIDSANNIDTINIDNVVEKIGQNIRHIRRKHGLSQKNLAALLGVSFQQVQKYENGTNRIRLEHVLLLRYHFNVDYEQIFPCMTSLSSAHQSAEERTRQKTIENIMTALTHINNNELLGKMHGIIRILGD